jgi:hypothetical protein
MTMKLGPGVGMKPVGSYGFTGIEPNYYDSLSQYMPETPVDYGVFGSTTRGVNGLVPTLNTANKNLYSLTETGFPGMVGPDGAGGMPGPMGFWDRLGAFGKSAVGTRENPGWGGLAVGAGSALMNAFMGMKQYGLAKSQLAESRRRYDQDYQAQKTLTNAQLEDRQHARVASNPGYQSVGAYMNQNRVA